MTSFVPGNGQSNCYRRCTILTCGPEIMKYRKIYINVKRKTWWDFHPIHLHNSYQSNQSIELIQDPLTKWFVLSICSITRPLYLATVKRLHTLSFMNLPGTLTHMAKCLCNPNREQQQRHISSSWTWAHFSEILLKLSYTCDTLWTQLTDVSWILLGQCNRWMALEQQSKYDENWEINIVESSASRPLMSTTYCLFHLHPIVRIISRDVYQYNLFHI